MPGSQSGCTCTRVCVRTCVVCARACRWRASRTRSRCRARTGTRSRARLAVCCCRRRGAGRRKHPWVCTSACCRPYRRSTTGGAYCGRACGAGLRQIPRVCTPAQPTAYHPVIHRLHLWLEPVADPTGSDPRVAGGSGGSGGSGISYWRTCGVVLGRTPGLHPRVTRVTEGAHSGAAPCGLRHQAGPTIIPLRRALHKLSRVGGCYL